MNQLDRYGATLNASDPEEYLAGQLRALHLAGQLPEPVRQYKFAADWTPPRKFQADFAFLKGRLIVEVDGGGFIAGGHNRGAGSRRDHERDAEAMCHGWRVLRVDPRQIENGQAVDWIVRLLQGG
jgi:very-short-patch-repair endonuclease